MPKYTVIIGGKERTIDKDKFDGNIEAIFTKYPDARIKAMNGDVEGTIPVSNYSRAIKQGYRMVETVGVEPVDAPIASTTLHPTLDSSQVQQRDSVKDYRPMVISSVSDKNKPFDIVKEMNEPTDAEKREAERKRIEEQAAQARKIANARSLNSKANVVQADYEAVMENPFLLITEPLTGVSVLTEKQIEARKQEELNRASAEKAEDTFNMVEEAKKKGDTSFVAGFGRGFWEKASKVSNWDLGARDLQSNLAIAAIAEKHSKGEKLSVEEDALLDAVALEAAALGEFSGDLGRGYKAGSTAAESLPFMAEFMINPATGIGKSVGRAVAKKIITNFGKEAAKSTIGKIARASARVAGDIVGAGVMAGTTGGIRTSADAVDRMSGEVKTVVDDDGYYRFAGHEDGDESIKAFAKAYGASTIENFSEMFGNYLVPMVGIVSEFTGRSMNKVGLGKINDLIGRVKSSDIAKIVDDFQGRTQWNGTISEYLEEQAGMAMNALTVGDNQLSDLVDKDTQIDVFLGVSALGGLFSGIKTAGYARQKYVEKRKLNEVERDVSSGVGEVWAGLKEQIDQADDAELVSILSNTMSDQSLNEKQKQDVLLYAGRLKAYHSASLSDLKRNTEGDTPDEIVQSQMNFDAGYKLAEADRIEKRRALKDLNEVEKKLDEDFLSLDEQGQYALSRHRSESGEDVSNELAYINAQSRFNGMIQGIRDVIDEKVAVSDQYITRLTHEDGNVYDVTLSADKNKHIFPVSGSIVVDDHGILDKKQSDSRFITRDENGVIGMHSVDDLYKVESAENANVIKGATAQSIREQESARHAEEIDTPSEEENLLGSNAAYSELDDISIDDYINSNPALTDFGKQRAYDNEEAGLEKAKQQAIVSLSYRNGEIGAKEMLVNDVYGYSEDTSDERLKEQAESLSEYWAKRYPEQIRLSGSERESQNMKKGAENSVPVKEIAGDIKRENEESAIPAEIDFSDITVDDYINSNSGLTDFGIQRARESEDTSIDRAKLQAETSLKYLQGEISAKEMVTSPAYQYSEEISNESAEEYAQKESSYWRDKYADRLQLPSTATVETGPEDISTEAAPEVAPERTMESLLLELPKKKDGAIDYKAMTPRQTFEYTKFSEGDETAISDLQADIVDATEELSKVETRVSKSKGADRIELREQSKVAKSRLSELQSIMGEVAPMKEEAVKDDVTQTPVMDADMLEWTADNSSDTNELLSAYNQAKEMASHDSKLKPWEQSLLGRKVSTDSFMRFADRNLITGQLAKGWLNKDAVSIDQISKEFEMEGIDVSDQDIVDFIIRNPSNYVRKTSDTQNKLGRKFSETASKASGLPIGGPESVTGRLFIQNMQQGKTIEGMAQAAQEQALQEDTEREEVLFNSIPENDTWTDEQIMEGVLDGVEYRDGEYISSNGMTVDEIDDIYSQLELEDNGRETEETSRQEDEFANPFDEAREIEELGAPEVITTQNREDKEGDSGVGRVENSEDLVSLQNANQLEHDGISESVSQGELRMEAQEGGKQEEPIFQLRRRIEEVSRDAQKGEGSRSSSAQEVNRMIETQAQENGLWTPIQSVPDLGVPFLSGNENDTYLDKDNNTVYKVNNLMNSKSLPELFTRIDLHNEFFPKTKYELAGFTGFGNGAAVYPIYKQEFVEDAILATPEEIDGYMQSLGFQQASQATYSNGDVVISDLHPRNVLKDKDGDIYVINADFKKNHLSTTPIRKEKENLFDYAKRIGASQATDEGNVGVPETTHKTLPFVAPEIKPDEDVYGYAERVVNSKKLYDEQSKVNTDPTDAQKEAGNYKMGHVKIGGHEVTIENPRGSVRRGVNADGKAWETPMNNTYGYFRGTQGKDGDHIDTFLGDNLEPENIYVVDQMNEDGSFDEHKVMYGFESEEDARAAYLSNYEDGWQGLGRITGVSREVFDQWLGNRAKKQKPFAEYKMIQGRTKGNSDVNALIASNVTNSRKFVPVFTEEEYIASHGYSFSGFGDVSLHKGRQKTDRLQNEIVEQQSSKDKELFEKREDLRKEYKNKVASGEIREPNHVEQLIKAAHGMSDLESTQAARRALKKRGVDWEGNIGVDAQTEAISFVTGRSVRDAKQDLTENNFDDIRYRSMNRLQAYANEFAASFIVDDLVSVLDHDVFVERLKEHGIESVEGPAINLGNGTILIDGSIVDDKKDLEKYVAHEIFHTFVRTQLSVEEVEEVGNEIGENRLNELLPEYTNDDVYQKTNELIAYIGNTLHGNGMLERTLNGEMDVNDLSKWMDSVLKDKSISKALFLINKILSNHEQRRAEREASMDSFKRRNAGESWRSISEQRRAGQVANSERKPGRNEEESRGVSSARQGEITHDIVSNEAPDIVTEKYVPNSTKDIWLKAQNPFVWVRESSEKNTDVRFRENETSSLQASANEFASMFMGDDVVFVLEHDVFVERLRENDIEAVEGPAVNLHNGNILIDKSYCEDENVMKKYIAHEIFHTFVYDHLSVGELEKVGVLIGEDTLSELTPGYEMEDTYGKVDELIALIGSSLYTVGKLQELLSGHISSNDLMIWVDAKLKRIPKNITPLVGKILKIIENERQQKETSRSEKRVHGLLGEEFVIPRGKRAYGEGLDSNSEIERGSGRGTSGVSSNSRKGEIIHDTVRREAQSLAEKLHTPIRMVEDVSEITDNDAVAQQRKRSSKGWFDPKSGKVVVVLPNAVNAEDVQATILHEVVAHKGLKDMLGRESFDEICRNVFNSIPKELQDELFGTYKSKEVAGDEYMASLAENGVDASLWNRIKGWFREAFRNMGIDLQIRDNDIVYMLWKSKNRLLELDDVLKMAENVVSDEKIKKRMSDGDLLFREGKEKKPERKSKVDRLSAEISDLRGRLRNNQEDLESTINAMQAFVSERLSTEAAKDMTKSDVEGLVREIGRATKKRELEDPMMAIERLINEVMIRKGSRELFELSRMKVQDRNNRGVSVAKKVDNGTRQVIEGIRNTFADLITSGMERDIRQLGKEAGVVEREMNRITVGERNNSAYDELKERLDELRKEQGILKEQRDDLLQNRVEETRVLIERHMTELEGKIQNAAEGKGVFTKEDGIEYDALSVRLMFVETQELTDGLLGIDRNIASVMSENRELRKVYTEENRKLSPNADILNGVKVHMNANHAKINGLRRERIAMQQSLIEKISEANDTLHEIIETGKSNLQIFNRKLTERKMELAKIAISAVKDKRIKGLNETMGKLERLGESVEDSMQLWKSPFKAPLYSFNFILKHMDRHSFAGDGELYQHFMKSNQGVNAAGDKYYQNWKSHVVEMEQRMKIIFGKDADAVMKEQGKVYNYSGIHITMMHDSDTYGKVGTKRELAMSKGQAMYVWMVWQMEDGRAKLESQGYDEDSMDEVKAFIGPKYVEFAEWVQDDFYPKLREERYNETHEHLFGTSMAKRDHYFPLRYTTESGQEKQELGEQVVGMPSLVTGNIINRVRNDRDINTGLSAFEVMYEYGEKIEEWNAYAEVRRDLNGLVTNRYLRNLMEANEKGLHREFRIACEVATRSFREDDKTGHINSFLTKANKGLAGGAITWRLNTALKQLLSAPAFLDFSSNPKFIATLMANSFTMGLDRKVGRRKMILNYQWCMENLPSFAERIDSGNMGNEKLDDKGFADWVDKYIKIGMIPNKFVDAFICSIGAKSVYDFARSRYLKAGLSESEAVNKAKFDASVAFNETQQSGRPEYMAAIQSSSHALWKSLTNFQNSNFGFYRKMVESFHDLTLEMQPQVDRIKEELVANGENEGKAERKAWKRVWRKKFDAVRRLALFGEIMQVSWALGSIGLMGWNGGGDDDEYYDDDEKSSIVVAALVGPLMGTLGLGQFASTVASGNDYQPMMLWGQLSKSWDGLSRVYNERGFFSKPMVYEICKQAMNTTGIRYETIENMILGVEGVIRDGDWSMLDTMYLLNTPDSQRKKVTSNMLKKRGFDEYVSEMARASKFLSKDGYWWVPGRKSPTEQRMNSIYTEWEKWQLSPEDRIEYEKDLDKRRRMNKITNNPDYSFQEKQEQISSILQE